MGFEYGINKTPTCDVKIFVKGAKMFNFPFTLFVCVTVKSPLTSVVLTRAVYTYDIRWHYVYTGMKVVILLYQPNLSTYSRDPPWHCLYTGIKVVILLYQPHLSIYTHDHR